MVLVCAKPVEVPRLCEHTAESAHRDGTFDVCNFGSTFKSRDGSKEAMRRNFHSRNMVGECQ